MPRGDRTGPDGLGPKTGRGLGFCNGYNSPGFQNRTSRRNLVNRRRRRHRHCNNSQRHEQYDYSSK